MDLFGIGPLELVLILLIALVVLGPQEMANSARKLAQFTRKVMRSPTWKQMMSTSREIRELPTRLARESGFQEQMDELKRESGVRFDQRPAVKPLSRPAPGELTPPPPTNPPVEKPPQLEKPAQVEKPPEVKKSRQVKKPQQVKRPTATGSKEENPAVTGPEEKSSAFNSPEGERPAVTGPEDEKPKVTGSE